MTTSNRYRFTVEQYYQMAEARILGPEERVEFIEGEIVEMAAIGPTHAWMVSRLIRVIMPQVGPELRVDAQNPLHLGPHTEPQPDLTVSRDLPGQIAHPTPTEILFAMEVSDTTLDYDRNTKLPLSAGAGIAESWLFDVKSWSLERHTEPRGGRYQQIERIGRGQSLPSTTLPTLTLSLDTLLR